MLLEIYSNLSNYIDSRRQQISHAEGSSLESILAKKEVLDTLRVRAFRHKNCFGNFLDVVSLQEGFTFDDQHFASLVQYLCSQSLKPCLIEGSDVVCFATEALLNDADIAATFCLSNTIVNRSLFSEVLIVLNSDQDLSAKLKSHSFDCHIIPKNSILAKFSLLAPAGLMSLSCRSSTEKQSWSFRLSQIEGVRIFHEFDGFTMSKGGRTHVYYSRLVEKHIALIGQKLVELNVSLGLEEIMLTHPRESAELYHSIYVAINFVYEFLLETRRAFPEAQQLFILFSAPGIDWISKCLKSILLHPKEQPAWFNVLYSLEMLNNLYSLDHFKKLQFNPIEIGKIKKSLQQFESAELPAVLMKQKASVIDQCRTYILKLENKEPEFLHNPPTIRYPDQQLLESRGYLILSSFNAKEKLLYKCLNQRNRKLVMIKRTAKGKNAVSSSSSNEFVTLMSLQHNNIVRYLDGFENAHFWFMVTEFCVENDLHRHNQMPEIEALNIGRQILNGLWYLHKNHFVHRDIKPGNIFKDGRGFVKLADFGEARLIPLNEDSGKFDLTQLSGTPAYMAPECLHKASVYPSADVWSFACVLIFLLTGQSPWAHCQTRMNVLFTLGATDELPYDIDSLNLSDDLKRILRRMLQREPTARPTVSQLLAEPIFINVPESII